MLTTLEKAKALKEFRGLRVALTSGALKTLEKAKSLKRFRELRVLLGGDGKPYLDQKERTLPEQQAKLLANFPSITTFIDAAKMNGYGNASISWNGAFCIIPIDNGNDNVVDNVVDVSFNVVGENKGKLLVRRWNTELSKYDVIASFDADEKNIQKAFVAAEEYIADRKPVKQVSQNIKEAALAILLYGKGVSSVWGLAGDKMADARQKIMSLFAGFQVAKSKSGVNAILEQIKDNIGEHDFSSARESSIEDKIVDAWLISTSQGVVFDVGAFKKGNQLNRDASDFGRQKDSYGFLGSYIGEAKASKFLKFSTDRKWAFAITESQKIKVGYTDGQENVSWVDGDFDSPILAYQALNSDRGYSFSPAQNLSPKELFLKEANAKRQEIDASGLSDAAKKISAIIEDVARNIATVDEAKKRLDSAIWESRNPLQSGEWRSSQSGQKFYFENMEYGAVVDTRKEGRSHSSDPWRTSDGQYFTGLREAKAHELETYSKQRLINDGFMDGVKTDIEQYEQPKDYTPLLNSIINGDVSVFDDKAKLTELVGAAQESGGDDMPDDKKGLFIEAIYAAGIQQLEGKGFELVD